MTIEKIHGLLGDKVLFRFITISKNGTSRGSRKLKKVCFVLACKNQFVVLKGKLNIIMKVWLVDSMDNSPQTSAY